MIAYLFYSVGDAMLLFTAEVEGQIDFGYDFLYLGLEGGHVVIKMNNFGGIGLTTVRRSTISVNDTEMHQIQVVFRSGDVDLLVDNSDRVSATGTYTVIIPQPITYYLYTHLYCLQWRGVVQLSHKLLIYCLVVLLSHSMDLLA